MNNPTTSIVGSIALMLAGMIAGFLSSRNIIPAADVGADTALICTALAGAIGIAISWFKATMSTASAHVDAVNSTAIPGVKAVSVNSPGAPVTIDSSGVVTPVAPAKGS